jgi:hypothetical protein
MERRYLGKPFDPGNDVWVDHLKMGRTSVVMLRAGTALRMPPILDQAVEFVRFLGCSCHSDFLP